MYPHSDHNNSRAQMKSRWKLTVGIFLVLIISSYLAFGLIKKPEAPQPGGALSLASIATTSVPALPEAQRKTIVAFGDSITAGYGINIMDAYPAILEQLLRDAQKDIVVINSGVSGETTAGGLRRADFVVAQNPDIVIIALGGNDVLRGIPPENTKNNLEQIIEKFQAGNVRVVLAGMYAPSNLGENYVREFNEIYPTLSKKYNIPLVPFLLAGVALDPTLNQADGIHPNQEGARIIAKDNILPVILPYVSPKID